MAEDMYGSFENPLLDAWENYDSFMKALRGGPSTDIDSLDCNNVQTILEYRNFEPTRIMELLIARAVDEGTTASEFHAEMKIIIQMRIQANSKLDIREIQYEKWYSTLRSLESKYEVLELACTDPDAVTFPRLCMMFPHYCVGQKPSIPITVSNQTFYGFSLEFGGLIPRGRILREDVREGIIIVHLFHLWHQNPSIPFRTHQILLKRRIQNGLLSDEKRVRFLEIQSVITLNGELYLSTKETFDFILQYNPDEFLKNIRWDLINNY